MEYSTDGDTWQTDYEPVWTLRSTYSWEAHFEPNETVEVVHSYKPSVGGTVAATFLAPADAYGDRAGEYKKKYCTDDKLHRRGQEDADQSRRNITARRSPRAGSPTSGRPATTGPVRSRSSR